MAVHKFTTELLKTRKKIEQKENFISQQNENIKIIKLINGMEIIGNAYYSMYTNDNNFLIKRPMVIMPMEETGHINFMPLVFSEEMVTNANIPIYTHAIVTIGTPFPELIKHYKIAITKLLEHIASIREAQKEEKNEEKSDV